MQKISRKKLSPLLILSLSATLVVVIFVALSVFPIPLLIPCTHPFSQNAVLALGIPLVFNLILAAKIPLETTKLTVVSVTALIFLAFWLGSYPFSPLGFSAGRIPVLRGFKFTTRARLNASVAPGGIVTLISGSPAAIEPVLLTGNVKCAWTSANGGNLDNPNDCDIAYSPPQADYDILKIRLQPACGLPESSAQIKISILP